MPSLSTLRGPVLSGLRSALVAASKNKTGAGSAIQVRHAGGANTMFNQPSRYPWHNFWDRLHLYATITAVPLGLFIAYMQIRIGPAKLKEIPEGYVPEEHEYYKDPIQRLMKKYHPLATHYSKDYERSLFYVNYHDQNRRRRLLSKKVYELNKQREDLRGWYFVPYDSTLQEASLQQLKNDENL